MRIDQAAKVLYYAVNKYTQRGPFGWRVTPWEKQPPTCHAAWIAGATALMVAMRAEYEVMRKASERDT